MSLIRSHNLTLRRVDGAATEILQICSKYIKEAARRIEEENLNKLKKRERFDFIWRVAVVGETVRQG